MLSQRVKKINSSPTVESAAKAIALKKAGKDIVDFSVGEPDFPTPEHIKQAAIEALHSNFTKYTANNGLLNLRQAIAQKLQAENNLSYQPDSIVVSSGAKHALFNVLLSILNDGDEAIIPAPYWGSYPEIVRLSAAKPVIVETSEISGFHLNAKQLEAAITPATKVFIFCNPVNPTGAAYSKEQLAELAEVLLKHDDILVISDEIYEKLLYDDFTFTSFASLHPQLKERTIIINGLSKAYAMTGWRLGYAAGPAQIIRAAAKIQSHSTSAASTISQYAGIAALRGPQDELSKMVNAFRERRDELMEYLSEIEGIAYQPPQGAFYVFPNVSSFYGSTSSGKTIRNSADFALYLLEEAGVVVVPGSGFGADNYIRISYSTSMDSIREGLKRTGIALQKLKTKKY